jgi:hypothetical protein
LFLLPEISAEVLFLFKPKSPMQDRSLCPSCCVREVKIDKGQGAKKRKVMGVPLSKTLSRKLNKNKMKRKGKKESSVILGKRARISLFHFVNSF